MSTNKDYGWEHATEVVEGGKRYVQCNYCKLKICNVISRLKTHLAGIEGYGRICPNVPEAVKMGFRNNFENHPVLNVLKLKDRKKQKRVPRPDHPTGQSTTSDVRPEENGQHDPNASQVEEVARLKRSLEVAENDVDRQRIRLEAAENDVGRQRRRFEAAKKEVARLKRSLSDVTPQT